ncbi:nuclear transport factor 2 family protein [Jongsikchunia kroppenstedtii]|uniref:nuclear transport factor 2 family protein n=1 Tax=Jongsikchunia kroppenstedtii TaxID=1121721 RepID=UPI00037E5A16|nr:nuclear transport factor 2 family protein [Jongsikchunia kroppenstedtii]
MTTDTNLSARLAALEDRAAIAGVVASYGPLVDAGEADRVAALWTEDGSYSVDGSVMAGRAEIAAMVRGSHHQGLIRRGCTHLLGAPTITVDDDSATATCQSVLMAGTGDGYAIVRLSINRFEFVRRDGHWLIERRVTHKLPVTGPTGDAA